jgi:hypothetical protein
MHEFETVKSKKAPAEVKTQMRDGVIWYSHGMCNYTTGARELWCSFPPSKKKWLNAPARERIAGWARIAKEKGVQRVGAAWWDAHLINSAVWAQRYESVKDWLMEKDAESLQSIRRYDHDDFRSFLGMGKAL